VLSNDVTAETVKTKVEAVVKIMGDVWMLQYSKGFKTVAKEVSDDQKNLLTDNITGYNQIFGAPRGAR
jgi:hypothetical protein